MVSSSVQNRFSLMWSHLYAFDFSLQICFLQPRRVFRNLLSQNVCLAKVSHSFKIVSIMLTIGPYEKVYIIPVTKYIWQMSQFRMISSVPNGSISRFLLSSKKDIMIGWGLRGLSKVNQACIKNPFFYIIWKKFHIQLIDSGKTSWQSDLSPQVWLYGSLSQQ